MYNCTKCFVTFSSVNFEEDGKILKKMGKFWRRWENFEEDGKILKKMGKFWRRWENFEEDGKILKKMGKFWRWENFEEDGKILTYSNSYYLVHKYLLKTRLLASCFQQQFTGIYVLLAGGQHNIFWLYLL